ncbi:AraC family transcriptional regulator [Xylophilus sp. GW821-FHT01B05]
MQTDRVVGWLLDGLEWNASVFHVGQYCGRWRASTAGHARASFHLILEGRCWLHLQGSAPVPLAARDGVFLMRDVPHFLSPYADPAIDCMAQPIQPLAASGVLGETGLACGFFSFDGAMRGLVTDAFPQCLVLRAADPAMVSVGALFDLMLEEARRGAAEPSAVMDRLSGLLFFYALRHVAKNDPYARGLWTLLRRPGFAPLVAELLQAPARPWSVQDMAQRVHLSRAAFFRQFGEACGQSPLQFLLLLRMQLAARRLEQGESIGQVAQAVGYESYAAFSRAFKRTLGEQPGAWQRAHTRDPRQAGTNEHKSATPGH